MPRCSLLAALALLVLGCAEQPKSTAELEAGELLDLIQSQQQADPRNHVEVDLGRFRITHTLAGGEGQLYVQFHLYGVLPQARQAALTEQMAHYDKRIRDAIIALVQRMETESLTDPSLAFLKTEVVAAVNSVLKQRLLVDVAFSDFSTDRAAGMPWSNAGPAAPAAGGHGGGGHGKH